MTTRAPRAWGTTYPHAMSSDCSSSARALSLHIISPRTCVCEGKRGGGQVKEGKDSKSMHILEAESKQGRCWLRVQEQGIDLDARGRRAPPSHPTSLAPHPSSSACASQATMPGTTYLCRQIPRDLLLH